MAPGSLDRLRKSDIFPRIALVILGFLVAAVTWFIGIGKLDRDYRENQSTLARESAHHAKQAIEILLSENNRMVRLFAEKSRDTIQRLAENPQNEQLADALRAEAATFFPDFFELTIADRSGALLLTDFSGFVGDVCQRQILDFTASGHLRNIFIHPNPFAYHYDIMSYWGDSGNPEGVFFISFKPGDIARILKQTQPQGHQLFLVHRTSGLIEVNQDGARDQLTRKLRLSEQESEAVLASVTIDNTQWRLVALPEPDLLSSYRKNLIGDSIAPGIVVLLVLAVALITIVRVEKVRLKTENELATLNQHLEERVAERTRELNRAISDLRIENEEKNQAKYLLESSEKRYALAVQGSNEGIWEWEFESGECYFSDRWLQMFEAESTEIRTLQDWIKRVDETDRPLLESVLEGACTGTLKSINCEYRVAVAEGDVRWFELHGSVETDEDRNPVRVAGSQGDITERKQTEKELEHRALFDTLTQLPNRVLFMDRLEKTLKMLKRDSSRQLAVLFMDLDNFKSVNDRLGHLAGDDLLRKFAKRLSERIRPSDTVARFSGDEFIMLLDPLEERSEALNLAQRIIDILSEEFIVHDTSINISGSIGIAFASDSYQDPNELVRDADIAMYRAKKSGRARYFVFDESVRVDLLDKLKIESSMKDVVHRGELIAEYQPIYRLSDMSLYGFEALMRWRHPELGMVMPDDFIQVAEDSGLIIPMGNWIVSQSLNDLNNWRRESKFADDLVVSVNLSGRQFLDHDLQEQIRNTLDKTGILGGSVALNLEITESVVMQNAPNATNVLDDLKSLGVSLAVDDFGTGYSSLAYLQSFPIDTLKIDKQFISGEGPINRNKAIVESVVTMAKKLDLQVIAEGVETADQLSMLNTVGCDFAQGYYLSKPLSSDAALNIIRNPG